MSLNALLKGRHLVRDGQTYLSSGPDGSIYYRSLDRLSLPHRKYW